MSYNYLPTSQAKIAQQKSNGSKLPQKHTYLSSICHADAKPTYLIFSDNVVVVAKLGTSLLFTNALAELPVVVAVVSHLAKGPGLAAKSILFKKLCNRLYQ